MRLTMKLGRKSFSRLVDKYGDVFPSAKDLGWCVELDRAEYHAAIRAKLPPKPERPGRYRLLALHGQRGRSQNFENFVELCRKHGHTVIDCDTPDDWRIIEAAIKANSGAQFTIRREENGCLFAKDKWRRTVNRLYGIGVIPLSLDFGYFGHYETFGIDRYLPDGAASAASVEVPLMSDATDNPPQWFLDYRSAFEAKLAKACLPPEGLTPGFVCIWIQYSPSLLRQPFRAATMAEWAGRCAQEIRDAGLVPVIKTSPILKRLEIEGTPQYSDRPVDAAGVIVDRSGLLNARMIRHARHHVICSTSASNEIVIGGAPVVACGRSWFNGLGVFKEAEDWPDITRTPEVDTRRRNQWINWWISRTVQKTGDPSQVFTDIAEGARKGPGFPEMAATLGRELSRWAKKGCPVVSAEQYQERISVCRNCPHWRKQGWIGLGKCGICGCSRFKLALATTRCPVDKW